MVRDYRGTSGATTRSCALQAHCCKTLRNEHTLCAKRQFVMHEKSNHRCCAKRHHVFTNAGSTLRVRDGIVADCIRIICVDAGTRSFRFSESITIDYASRQQRGYSTSQPARLSSFLPGGNNKNDINPASTTTGRLARDGCGAGSLANWPRIRARPAGSRRSRLRQSPARRTNRTTRTISRRPIGAARRTTKGKVDPG